MVFLFAMLWGTASTVMGAPARKSFSEFFRNLVDGLLKGHAKPASFKLVRTNLMAVRKNYLIYFLYGSPLKYEAIELWYQKQWIIWTFFWRTLAQFSTTRLIQLSQDFGVRGQISPQMKRSKQKMRKRDRWLFRLQKLWNNHSFLRLHWSWGFL